MFIVIMRKSKRKESPLAWLSKFLFQRGLPYLLLHLLCAMEFTLPMLY